MKFKLRREICKISNHGLVAFLESKGFNRYKGTKTDGTVLLHEQADNNLPAYFEDTPELRAAVTEYKQNQKG